MPDALSFGGNRGTQVGKQTALDFDDLLLRVENLRLILLQFGSRKALGIHQRLLALVIGGREMQVRLRNLNVVAKNRIELDLERANAGAFALTRFDLCQVLLRVAAQVAEFVEVFVNARRDDATIAQRQRRLWNERAVDSLTQVAEFVDRDMQCAEARRSQTGKHGSHLGNTSQRCRQRQHVSRIRRLQRDAAEQTLKIKNSVERPAQFFAAHRVSDLCCNRIQPAFDLGSIQRRAQHPRPQQAFTHRRHGRVQAAKQSHSAVGSRK